MMSCGCCGFWLNWGVCLMKEWWRATGYNKWIYHPNPDLGYFLCRVSSWAAAALTWALGEQRDSWVANGIWMWIKGYLSYHSLTSLSVLCLSSLALFLKSLTLPFYYSFNLSLACTISQSCFTPCRIVYHGTFPARPSSGLIPCNVELWAYSKDLDQFNPRAYS